MNDRDQIIAELETTQRLLMEARAEIARGKRRIAELRRAGERRRCAHRDEIARYHTDLVDEGIARLDAEARVAALDAELATNKTVINALRQAGDAEITRLTTAHRELAGDGLEIVREAIIDAEHAAAALADRDAQVTEACAVYLDRNYGSEAAEAVAALRTQVYGPILTGPRPVQGPELHKAGCRFPDFTCICGVQKGPQPVKDAEPCRDFVSKDPGAGAHYPH